MPFKFNPLTAQFDWTDNFNSNSFVLRAGDTMSGNLNMGFNQFEDFVIQKLSVLPTSSAEGSMVYYTIDKHLYLRI